MTDARSPRQSRYVTAGGRGPAARPVEIELKYRPRSLAAAERLLASGELAGLAAVAPTRTTQLEDRYLDTAGGALSRAGFAARVRTSATGTIVSVKSTAPREPDGPHRREELEGPADRTSTPRDWPPSDARSLILELCGDAQLVELVTIRQLRRRRLLRGGATTVELSLDEIDVVERSEILERWVELEVELVTGDERRLLDAAAALDANPDFEPVAASKLDTALAAVEAHARRRAPRAARASASGGDGCRRPRQRDSGQSRRAPRRP